MPTENTGHVGGDRARTILWKVTIMPELTDKQLQKFLKELMEIQRSYANEQKNQKSNRQTEVRNLLDRFVAKEARDEN